MSAYDAFRAAVEGGDHAGMVAALAPDAVLRSPVSFKPFEGREAVAELFGILLETFEDFRYTDEFEAHGKAALVFRARVGDRELEGLDLFRFDGEGQIAELTVMVRPLSAVIALAEAVGPKLAAA
jgi:SnoaL-like domain